MYQPVNQIVGMIAGDSDMQKIVTAGESFVARQLRNAAEIEIHYDGASANGLFTSWNTVSKEMADFTKARREVGDQPQALIIRQSGTVTDIYNVRLYEIDDQYTDPAANKILNMNLNVGSSDLEKWRVFNKSFYSDIWLEFDISITPLNNPLNDPSIHDCSAMVPPCTTTHPCNGLDGRGIQERNKTFLGMRVQAYRGTGISLANSASFSDTQLTWIGRTGEDQLPSAETFEARFFDESTGTMHVGPPPTINTREWVILYHNNINHEYREPACKPSCDAADIIPVYNIPGDITSGQKIIPATCIIPEYGVSQCQKCYKLHYFVTGPALGHLGTWNPDPYNLSLDCQTPGIEIRVCTRYGCDAPPETQSYTQPHNNTGGWVVTLAATCVAEGTQELKCDNILSDGVTVCGLPYASVQIPPLGHTWIVNSGTDADGWGPDPLDPDKIIRICDICGNREEYTLACPLCGTIPACVVCAGVDGCGQRICQHAPWGGADGCGLCGCTVCYPATSGRKPGCEICGGGAAGGETCVPGDISVGTPTYETGWGPSQISLNLNQSGDLSGWKVVLQTANNVTADGTAGGSGTFTVSNKSNLIILEGSPLDPWGNGDVRINVSGNPGAITVVRTAGPPACPLISPCEGTLPDDKVCPAGGHEFEIVGYTDVFDCTEGGKADKVCKNCGVAVYDAETPSRPHMRGDLVETEPATCTADGKKVRKCQWCNYKYPEEGDDVEIIPRTGHHVESWVINAESTCYSKGEREGLCLICGSSVKEELAQLEHTYSDWDVETPAGCVSEGIEVRYCSLCGNKQEQAIPSDGSHLWEDDTATCENDGVKTCSRCSGTEATLAMGHIEKIMPVSPPNCTSRAKIKIVCERPTCGATLADEQDDMDTTPLGHTWTDDYLSAGEGGHVKKCVRFDACGICDTTVLAHVLADKDGVDTDFPATCKDEGVQTVQCTDCGFEKTKSLPKTEDHTYGAWTLSPSNPSLRTRICAVCGETEECGELGIEFHIWGSGGGWSAPDPSGICRRTCEKCGFEDTKVSDLCGRCGCKTCYPDTDGVKPDCEICGGGAAGGEACVPDDISVGTPEYRIDWGSPQISLNLNQSGNLSGWKVVLQTANNVTADGTAGGSGTFTVSNKGDLIILEGSPLDPWSNGDVRINVSGNPGAITVVRTGAATPCKLASGQYDCCDGTNHNWGEWQDLPADADKQIRYCVNNRCSASDERDKPQETEPVTVADTTANPAVLLDVKLDKYSGGYDVITITNTNDTDVTNWTLTVNRNDSGWCNIIEQFWNGSTTVHGVNINLVSDVNNKAVGTISNLSGQNYVSSNGGSLIIILQHDSGTQINDVSITVN
jgi:hypothetical protein